MRKLRLKYPLPQICRVLKVSASGYYAWVDRPLSKWAREEARLEIEIKAAHRRTREVYGAEKLQHDLAAHGIKAGVCRIKRIKRKLSLRCKQKRKFKATTNSNHRLPVAENILGQQFKVIAPNKVWVSDITYVPNQSLFRGIKTKRPSKGLLHHSDRGSQYCSHDFRNILKQHGFIASMSRKGNCYDNAPMESFWGTLKQELIHHCHYRTRGYYRVY